MKQVLDAAGIRTPRHAARDHREARCARRPSGSATRSSSSRSPAPAPRTPIACDDAAELEAVLPQRAPRARGQRRGVHRGRGVHVRHRLRRRRGSLYHNICWYRPRPLIARHARVDQPADGGAARPRRARARRRPGAWARRCSRRSASATGFTHMEWYLKADGEAGVRRDRRPPARRAHRRHHEFRRRHRPVPRLGGGRGARALLAAASSASTTARSIFKRAQGQGRIQRIEGLERLLAEFGEHVVAVDLLPIGAPRRNWKQTLISDGY